MRVLVGIPCLLTGGTEVQTLSLVEAIVSAGHEVTVACYFEHTEAMADRYRQAGANVELMSHDGIRPVGVRAVCRHIYLGFKRIVKSFMPDVAHVQYMAPGALPVVILRLLGVKKVIATSHTFADIYSPNGLRVIRWLTSTCLSAFQCITERAERSYFGTSRLFDGKLSKHFTIYNNIPAHISVLDAPRRPLTEIDTITVGVVSRLELIKGMDLVVPAFVRAAETNPRLRLLVVGDGSQRALMERQVAEAGIGSRVEFTGRQPQSQLQWQYDRIDILLMPSRSEGFGLTAIEGMARGCVPIVADTGGLPEVVTPESGLLHRSEDIADLSSKISALASDPSHIALLSAGAIRRAEVFSVSNYRHAIASLYKVL